jgi:hypothetical protein
MQKILLALLLLATLRGFGQDCSGSLLFKEGTELEYRNYMSQMSFLGKGGFAEITRLVYTVSTVKEGAGSTVSYITKTGYGANEKISYEKELTVFCDKKSLFFDASYYGIDTTFMITKITGYREDQVFLTTTASGDKYNFPLTLANGTQLPDMQTTMVITNYTPGIAGAPGAQAMEKPYLIGNRNAPPRRYAPDYKVSALSKNMKVTGEEEVHTAAGVFKCYKITAQTDAKIEHIPGAHSGTTVLYYNPGVGMVKVESFVGGLKAGYMELVRVKK